MQILDSIIQLLYFVLFLITPLVMTSFTSELFEFNKMLFIYFVAALVFFFWSAKMILNKKIILKKTVLDIPILLFLLIQILSTIFSIDPHTSFFGYYGRFNGGLLSTITYIFLYYAFVSNIGTGPVFHKFLDRLLKVSLISSFLVILWGLPGRFGHDVSCLVFSGQFNNSCWTAQFHPDLRMFSTLGQPNWLGAYLAINFFIAAFFLCKDIFKNGAGKKDLAKGYINSKQLSFWQAGPLRKESFILYAYLFLNFSAILFTRSRSALAATVIGIGMLFGALFVFPLFRKNSLGLKYIMLPLTFLFLIALFAFKTDIGFLDSILSLSFFSKPKTTAVAAHSVPATNASNTIEITSSFAIRKIVWIGAIRLANRYPLLGTGPETFAYAYYFVRPRAHNMTSEWDYLYNKAHNEYLNFLATTGYLGLITYMLMVFGVLYFFIRQIITRSKKDTNEYTSLLVNICFLCGYTTILVTNFVGFSTTTINLFFFIIPAAGILYIAPHAESDKEANKLTISIPQWAGVAVIALVSVYMGTYIVRYYFADTMYAMGYNYSKQSDYQTAVTYLQNALELKYEHVYEDALSYALANLAVLVTYQKQKDVANKLMSLSDYYNKSSIKASPKNVLYWKTRAKDEYLFYEINLRQQEIVKGVQALQEAYALSPTDPKIPYSMAVFYSLLYDDEKNPLNKKQYENMSLQYIEQAVQLKTDYRDAYLLEGQLYKKYGLKDQAKKAFDYILKNLNNRDQEAKKELKSL